MAIQGNFYDNYGIYRGSCNADNSFTNEHGYFAGHMDNNQLYDSYGNRVGYVDHYGSIYDSNHIYRGRITHDGSIYDENSCYKGRIVR